MKCKWNYANLLPKIVEVSQSGKQKPSSGFIQTASSGVDSVGIQFTPQELSVTRFMGQLFGFFMGLAGIGSGTFLAYNGFTTVGAIIAGSTVVSLVSISPCFSHITD
jgi:hypothetical protein